MFLVGSIVKIGEWNSCLPKFLLKVCLMEEITNNYEYFVAEIEGG